MEVDYSAVSQPELTNVNQYMPPEARQLRCEVPIKLEFLKPIFVSTSTSKVGEKRPREEDEMGEDLEEAGLVSRVAGNEGEQGTKGHKGRYTKRAKKERRAQQKQTQYLGIGLCARFAFENDCPFGPR